MLGEVNYDGHSPGTSVSSGKRSCANSVSMAHLLWSEGDMDGGEWMFYLLVGEEFFDGHVCMDSTQHGRSGCAE
jgi:hypothetical protein